MTIKLADHQKEAGKKAMFQNFLLHLGRLWKNKPKKVKRIQKLKETDIQCKSVSVLLDLTKNQLIIYKNTKTKRIDNKLNKCLLFYLDYS